MQDPVPAEFITLPDALHRLEGHVSEAHLQRARNDFKDRRTAFEQSFGAIEGRNATAPSFIVSSSDWPLLTTILRYASARDFAVEKTQPSVAKRRARCHGAQTTDRRVVPIEASRLAIRTISGPNNSRWYDSGLSGSRI